MTSENLLGDQLQLTANNSEINMYKLIILSILVLCGCGTASKNDVLIESRELVDSNDIFNDSSPDSNVNNFETEEQSMTIEDTDSAPLENNDDIDFDPIISSLEEEEIETYAIDKNPLKILEDERSLLSKREIYFDLDSYEINIKFSDLIEAHAEFLKKNPEFKITIQGNCDVRGSREYNIALGQRRANSVKDALILFGVSENQIDAISFGSEKPVSEGNSEASHSKNRRSDIIYHDFSKD